MKLNIFFTVLLSLFTLSCTSISKVEFNDLENVPIQLELKPYENKEEFQVTSISITQTFSNTELIHKLEESVTFDLVSEVKKRDDETFNLSLTTLNKDGIVDLNSIGYPENKETIEYIVHKDSQILKANSYPDKSLFFIPQLPLPTFEVKTNDTWAYSFDWVVFESLQILKLDLVLTLNKAYHCGKDLCIDVKYSGKIQPNEKNKIPIDSQLNGEISYNLSKAQLVRAYQTNSEEVQIEGTRVVSFSCTETLLKSKDKKSACLAFKK